MHIIKQKKDGLYIVRSKELGFFSTVEMKILNFLAKEHSYPKNIAKHIGMHEQNVYYHIRRLEKLGAVKVIRREERGAYMAKIYGLSSPSFFVNLGNFSKSGKIPKLENEFLKPFIEEGKLNAKIIVGSPDPHGPERARSRDAYYGIDLGLFLGTFLSEASASVSLDTEIHRHDLRNNLILIGGPVINRVTKMINEKLAIRFDEKKNIYSTITKKTYKSDDCGIVVKTENPFDKQKKILVVAGKRYSGTRSSTLSFIRSFEKLCEGNMKNKKLCAKVVEGIDRDGDGVVDDVKILE